jgi:hypothetical protein
MSKPFTRIFKDDHDKAVAAGSMALLVYLALCRIQSDALPEEKECFRAGAARIGRQCGLSRRTVQTWLHRLAGEGLVEIVSGRRKDRESDHEENRITLKGSAGDTLRSARESGGRCARIKKLSPKERERKERRPAGSAAGAALSTGAEKEAAAGWYHIL